MNDDVKRLFELSRRVEERSLEIQKRVTEQAERLKEIHRLQDEYMIRKGLLKRPANATPSNNSPD